MERLTELDEYTEQARLKYYTDKEWEGLKGLMSDVQEMDVMNAINKLAHYEDLEEQGRLIVLHCNKNEWVWVAHEKRKCAYKVLYTCISDILADMEEGFVFGYTKSEAEKALAEMEK